jgi:hypothetical protein
MNAPCIWVIVDRLPKMVHVEAKYITKAFTAWESARYYRDWVLVSDPKAKLHVTQSGVTDHRNSVA